MITKAMQASGGLNSPRVSVHKSAFLKLAGSSELGLGERTVGSVLGARRPCSPALSPRGLALNLQAILLLRPSRY